MTPTSPRWKEITPSQYPWEQEALAFLRDGLPDSDPVRVWSNFEFISDDGSVNEVDALVLTAKGFFMVEIKSWPGTPRRPAASGRSITRAGSRSTTTRTCLPTGRRRSSLRC